MAATPGPASRARRLAPRVALALIALLLVIQLVPYGRRHENPPVVAEPAWDSPRTRELFFRACRDCHSHETVWPWYADVAPVSWLLQHDVDEGRAELNVSDWSRPQKEARESAQTVRDGEMPPWFYLPLHPEAQLSEQETAELVRGLVATFGDKKPRGSAAAKE